VSEQPQRPAQDLTARELTTKLGEQLSRLMREEVALARAEMFANARQAMMGGGLFGGAALFGHTGWLVLVAAAVAGIAVVLPVWAAALIIGGALVVIAGVLAMLGRQRFKRGVPPLRMTTDTIREDVGELAGKVRR
jgi:Putative Actinobacterial Holin-X, holin superfamily III